MKPRLKTDQLGKWFGRARPPRAFEPGEGIWALSGVSFEVPGGEALGLVGPNGAGKTTLLRLAAGILYPNSGSLQIHGRATSVLELTAPFSPVLTGAENLRLALQLQGAPSGDLDRLHGEAAAFSGLGGKLGEPLSSYSQGMILRLGFSAATAFVGDLLLLDELLLVGDEEFQVKCNRRVLSLLERGTTVIFASHDLYRIEMLCRRTIWLDQGKIRDDGPSAGVLDAYKRSAGDARELPAHAFGATSGWIHHTSAAMPVRIAGFRILGPDGLEARSFSTGSRFGFEVSLEGDVPLPSMLVSFYVYRSDGLLVSQFGHAFDAPDGGRTRALIKGECPELPLTTGEYSLNIALIPKGLVVGYFDYETGRRFFSIDNSRSGFELRAGVFRLPVNFREEDGR